jgi:hypothetical protein
MLVGTTTKYITQQFTGALPPIQPSAASMDVISLLNGNQADRNDTGPISDLRLETDIWLAAQHHMLEYICIKGMPCVLIFISEKGYPSSLTHLATFITVFCM